MCIRDRSPTAQRPMTRRVSGTSPTTGPSWDHTVYVPAGCFLGHKDPADDAPACVEGLNDRPVGNGSFQHFRRGLLKHEIGT
eukprot:5003559-Pyramimonas_sp.AAC.1